MKPIFRLRTRASSSSERPATVRPSSEYVPVVGRSRHPSTFIIVDLPEPDGPMSATYSLRAMVRLMSASATNCVVPIWYVLPMPRSSITSFLRGRFGLGRAGGFGGVELNLLAVEQE